MKTVLAKHPDPPGTETIVEMWTFVAQVGKVSGKLDELVTLVRSE